MNSPQGEGHSRPPPLLCPGKSRSSSVSAPAPYSHSTSPYSCIPHPQLLQPTVLNICMSALTLSIILKNTQTVAMPFTNTNTPSSLTEAHTHPPTHHRGLYQGQETVITPSIPRASEGRDQTRHFRSALPTQQSHPPMFGWLPPAMLWW